MDALSNLVISSISEYFPPMENKDESFKAFERLLVNNVHNEKSSSRLRWNAFVEKLRANTTSEIRDVTNLQFPSFICSIAVEEFNVRNVEYFRNILLTFSLIGKYFTITERVFLKTEVDGKRYESFLILKTYSNKTKLHPIYSDIIKLYYPDWYFIPKSLWSNGISNFSLPDTIKDNNYLIYNFLFGNLRPAQFIIDE